MKLRDERVRVFYLQVIQLLFGFLRVEFGDAHGDPLRTKEDPIPHSQVLRFHPFGLLDAELKLAGVSNGFVNALQIGQHLPGRDAQHLQAQLAEIGIAGLIVSQCLFAAVGQHAVHLDDKLGVAAVKICYIPTDGMLASEGETGLVVAQRRPQLTLRRGHFTPQHFASPAQPPGNARPVVMPSQ